MNLSKQLSDFAGNVDRSPEAPSKAALVASIRETTMALRAYEADLIVHPPEPPKE